MLLGGGMWQCAEMGGGTASATVDVVVRQRGGGCSDDSGNVGGDIVAMAVTRAGVEQRDEIGWGEEEDVVLMAAAMSLREGAVHDTTRGGGADDARHCRRYLKVFYHYLCTVYPHHHATSCIWWSKP